MTPLLTKLGEEGEALTQAPLVAASWALSIGLLLWVLVRKLKANQIADLESRLRLRDDEISDYKRKLEGATPDEAAERFSELEADVARLKLRDEEIADYRQKLEGASPVEAAERIAKLETVVARLTKAPRIVSPKVIKELETWPKRGPWQIEYIAGDAESYQFAVQVREYMAKNGFAVNNTYDSIIPAGPVEGLHVLKPTMKDLDTQYWRVLIGSQPDPTNVPNNGKPQINEGPKERHVPDLRQALASVRSCGVPIQVRVYGSEGEMKGFGKELVRRLSEADFDATEFGDDGGTRYIRDILIEPAQSPASRKVARAIAQALAAEGISVELGEGLAIWKDHDFVRIAVGANA